MAFLVVLESMTPTERVSRSPFTTSSWPKSKKLIAEQFEGIPTGERELMLSGNAAGVWNL
jgi:hypothetical protein